MNRIHMNWQQGTAPHINRSKHLEANAHALESMERATNCARWLHAQGYTLLGIATGRRNPRIEIAACRMCAQLNGVVRMTERQYNHPAVHSMVAIYFGCEVRWDVTEDLL